MFKRNHINTAILAGALTLSTATVFAQQDVDVSATVSVQNAFNFSQASALSFGTIRVTQTVSDPLDVGASITIPADGSTPTVTAADNTTNPTSEGTISVITPGVPAQFTIDSAAPNTAMTISTIASTTLTNVATTAGFVLDFTLTDDVQVVGGPNDGQAYTSFNLVTDATGAVGFALGGTLTTEVDEDQYEDVTYSGDYTVEVDY